MSLRPYLYYETSRIDSSLCNGIVVEKDSATLCYHNDRTASMQAIHRKTCKNAIPKDHNFHTSHNALASAIVACWAEQRTTQHEIDGESPAEGGQSPWRDGHIRGASFCYKATVKHTVAWCR